MVAALVGLLNAVMPPMVAALRLPFMVGLGFILVLLLDAWMLMAASRHRPGLVPRSTRTAWRSWSALVAAAVSVMLTVIFGANDDDTYTLRVIQRIARRSGERTATDVPGIIYPRDRRPRPPRAPQGDPRRQRPADGRVDGAGAATTLVEWEPDLSSQTGASQAGILLGSNEDIPAFRWVEKETRRR